MAEPPPMVEAGRAGNGAWTETRRETRDWPAPETNASPLTPGQSGVERCSCRSTSPPRRPGFSNRATPHAKDQNNTGFPNLRRHT